MKYLPLIWAGVWRRPVRTALTMISIASAFVLFGVLQGFSSGLDQLVNSAQADLLITESRVSALDRLPIADLLLGAVRSTPGVRAVAREVAFGGIFQPPADFVPAWAVDGDELRQIDDKLTETPAQWAALKATRTGALAPGDLAATHGWKVGDRIPLKPGYYVNKDGTNVWQVDIVGTFPSNADDPFFNDVMLLNYDYADDSRTPRARARSTASLSAPPAPRKSARWRPPSTRPSPTPTTRPGPTACANWPWPPSIGSATSAWRCS